MTELGRRVVACQLVFPSPLPRNGRSFSGTTTFSVRDAFSGGSSFTVRRFRDKPVSPTELLSWGTVSPVIGGAYGTGLSVFQNGNTTTRPEGLGGSAG